ncbi:hypothetical protein Nepgr_025614 [Nepenthes gracilis]|uniref:Uncharacterized protein n=1 Tax=Nepenthes gracilis TaxID=150966 RepID=A0AAD3T718_NEPGR|nr:hypothetical protein Nepgr_025614 [Nepenthes gracilis]
MPEYSSDEDNVVIEKLKKIKKSSQQMVSTLPSAPVGSSDTCQSSELPISIGRSKIDRSICALNLRG